MEWISVKIRKPKQDIPVLCLLENGSWAVLKREGEYEYRSLIPYDPDWVLYNTVHRVTHWMSLPPLVMEWISVKDQPIPKDVAVLLFTEGKVKIGIWESDIDDFIPNCGCHGWEHEREKIMATYWMTLPEPPQEKK